MNFCRFFLILLSSISFYAVKAQDTLYIGNKKIPLTRAKLFHSGIQGGAVLLPSEYTEHSREVLIPFRHFNDTITEIENDDDGGQIVFKIYRPRIQDTSEQKLYLLSFVDTITINSSELARFAPYIKSRGKRIYFCAARIRTLEDKTVNEFGIKFSNSGTLLDYWESLVYSEPKKDLKKTTFLLQGMYYTRGNATYYIHRDFVILCK